MGAMASQITNRTIVYSTVYSDADQRKYQSSASLAFVWGIHRWPVNSPHKWPVTRKMFPFDEVIMVVFFVGRYWQDTHICHVTSSASKGYNIIASVLAKYPRRVGGSKSRTSLTPKRLGHFFKNLILFRNVVHHKWIIIFLYEIGLIQWMFSQHCGYWWPGALAPGHQ